MSTETKESKLTYKERVRRSFTGKGLMELVASASIMFVFIYAINTYREGYLGLASSLLMVGVFVVVWPVMTLFWLTLEHSVAKIRSDSAVEEPDPVTDPAEDTKEEVTTEDTIEDTLQASAESDKEGVDRV